MQNSPLRRSSAGMGRKKKTKNSLEHTAAAAGAASEDIFFEEWMSDETEQGTKDPLWSAADTELQVIKEESGPPSEAEIKNRFLEYYVTMQASAECLLLPGKLSAAAAASSPKLIVARALKYYNSFCKQNYSLCGNLPLEIPCIIQLGGVLACAEFERLSLNPKFSKWIDNLTDLDSALCIIANQLVRESNSLVRCWWSPQNQCFVLFCHITNPAIPEAIPTTTDVGMITEEEEEKQAVVLVVKPIPVRRRVVTVKHLPIRQQQQQQIKGEDHHKD